MGPRAAQALRVYQINGRGPGGPTADHSAVSAEEQGVYLGAAREAPAGTGRPARKRSHRIRVTEQQPGIRWTPSKKRGDEPGAKCVARARRVHARHVERR